MTHYDYFLKEMQDATDSYTIYAALERAKRDYSVSPQQHNYLVFYSIDLLNTLKLKQQPKMKKLVKELPKPTIDPITVEQLTNNELVAYACQSSGNAGNYAVLTKLSNCEWGFINLGNSNNQPVYKATTRQDAIKLASSSRQLYMFDTMTEMIRCINAKVF